jgi:hypothetical protein
METATVDLESLVDRIQKLERQNRMLKLSGLGGFSRLQLLS